MTYEYLCESCGHEFERQQRITEDPIKACEKCNSQTARRKISASAFVLKGGGWYADGYGSKAASSESKSDSACPKPGCGSSTPCASES